MRQDSFGNIVVQVACLFFHAQERRQNSSQLTTVHRSKSDASCPKLFPQPCFFFAAAASSGFLLLPKISEIKCKMFYERSTKVSSFGEGWAKKMQKNAVFPWYSITSSITLSVADVVVVDRRRLCRTRDGSLSIRKGERREDI